MAERSTPDSAAIIQRLVKAHEEASRVELARVRKLSVGERAALIEAACEAAVTIERSRVAAGLPAVEPAPWPASTWEFLKRHSARGRI